MRSPLGGLSLLLLLLLLSWWHMTRVRAEHPLLTINRHHKGDMFVAGSLSCPDGACVGTSGGTAGPAEGTDCACQCLPHLPVFRDDLQVCINDIHECTLAPFVSGPASQRIPFVFLPLEGQIVHPSAEISFSGVSTPICVVSSAQFLTRNGWADLRNSVYTEPPFRLFRDEGRTFLQWLGEVDLRLRMEGRLILVHLLCKDVGVAASASQDQTLFTPCVAFRVAGSPRDTNVPEVSFPSDGTRGGLSVSEYVAIGVCSILLGLIYVASVLLYLHVRRRRRGCSKKDVVQLSAAEEGIVKKNPLLAAATSRHHLAGLASLSTLGGADNASYVSDSASCCSDTDGGSDNAPLSDDSSRGSQNVQITAAMVHSCTLPFDELRFSEPMHLQDSSSFERLPEENVSIVETLEGREDRPETVRAIASGVARRKLYFNPAFFEPELLHAPPPAAIEFLTKIREVICIAKHKMAAKRFAPSLLGIPEESGDTDLNIVPCTSAELEAATVSGTSLKRENSRRRNIDVIAPAVSSSCLACCPSTTESKQRSIRRWLEDVPVGRTCTKGRAPNAPNSNKQEPGGSSAVVKSLAQTAGIKRNNSKRSPAPPPPVTTASPTNPKPIEQTKSNTGQAVQQQKIPQPSLSPTSPPSCPLPPPMPPPSSTETRRKANRKDDKADATSDGPVVAKKLMDAVIKELVGHTKKPSLPTRNESLTVRVANQQDADFEADSLERSGYSNKEGEDKGMATPSDYGEVASQPSPSLSAALPLEEEMTMRNEIFNIHTGSTTISKLKSDNMHNSAKQAQDDHEYEIIVLNPEASLQNDDNKDMKVYSLPELLNNDGYSLVSEVYVNDGYNFSSTPSSPGNTSSTSTSSGPKIRYFEPDKKPGHLTIQVEDSPDNYVHLPDDSDSFEPDTLDRKPSRRKRSEKIIIEATHCHQNCETFTDSLERPQIMLRTTGSFRSDSLGRSESIELARILATSPLNRAFGSLREIYEARTKMQQNRDDTCSIISSTHSLNDKNCNLTHSWKRGHRLQDGMGFEGIFLNPEAKQARRQRRPTPPSSSKKPRSISLSEVTPPRPPKPNCVYPDMRSPRSTHKSLKEATPPLPPRIIKPPLPPKNGAGRSTSQKRTGSNPACRPLPPLPNPNCSHSLTQDDENATIVTTSVSKDLETLSILSGASADSLNSSDYEAFYTMPFSGDEEADGSQTLGQRVEHCLNNKFPPHGNEDKHSTKGQCIIPSSTVKSQKSNHLSNKKNNQKKTEGTEKDFTKDTVSKGMQIALGISQRIGKDSSKHVRDKKSSESTKKSWRKGSPSKTANKPEDSGYLSTDSNDSAGRQAASVSETDESLCDGASESGAESIATDSFFFGSFRKLSTCEIVTESVDSGVGSDLVRTTNNSTLLEDVAASSSSESENMSSITVKTKGEHSVIGC